MAASASRKRAKRSGKAASRQSEPDRVENGVMIRGADGKMYFIPDKALRSFRLPERSAKPAREIVDDEGGLAVRQLGAITSLPALHGPIGLRARDFNAVAINPTIPGKIALGNLRFER